MLNLKTPQIIWFENDFDKQQLYKQSIACNCKGCSSAKVFQELKTEEDYLKDSDEKISIYLERNKGYLNELEKITRNDSDVSVTMNLKTSAVKKMSLRVAIYSEGEYLYVLFQLGLTMIYKMYTIKKDDS